MNIQSNIGPFLTNTFGDRYLYGINRDVFGKIGSDNLFRRQLGDLLQEDRFHLVVGTDSGLLPRYILNAGVPQGARYLFIEHPDVLAAIQEELDPEILGEHILCTTYDQYQEKALGLNFSAYIFLGQVLLHQSIAAQDDFPGIYQELIWNVRKEINQFVWHVNMSLGSEVFIQRQFENLAENQLSAKCLENLFPGKTAVLLAGGPSLDDILPWVKKNRENLVVMAVSRISRRLQEVNIAPDLIFSIDPHPVSFDVSKETLSFWKEAILVHMYHVTPLLLGQWRGQSLFIGSRFLWKSPLDADSVSAPGPTVTNTALTVAVKMGFSQIILAGVDLCFSREGFTHASGSNERQAGPQLGRTCMQIQTNGGWLAETDHDLFSAINQLSSQAKAALERGCKFINSSPGAAGVENVRFQPIDDIEISSLEETARQTLGTFLPEETSAGRCAYYQQILDELTQAGRRLRQIEQLAIRGIKANDGLFGRRGKQANFNNKLKMDRIEKKINKDVEFSRLVKKFGVRHFLGVTRTDMTREWTDEEIERTGSIYYRSYRDSARHLLNLIDKAQSRLRARLNEEKEASDLDLLIRQWRSDSQPGRALLWQDRHGQKEGGELPPEMTVELNTLKEQYLQVLENRETPHSKRCRSYAGLESIGAKTRGLFRLQDQEGLVALLRGLSVHSDVEAQYCVALVEGCLAELQGDSDAALAAYQGIIDAPYLPLLEDALRRVVSITLTRGENDEALLALSCLSAVSPAYTLQYADLLRLSGNHRDALEAYADFLEKAPDDLAAMMKLGLYYRDLGLNEGAELMFRNILENNPGNRAASQLLEELAVAVDEKPTALDV
jgi:tetratricopeptide (TPR) repeat protein